MGNRAHRKTVGFAMDLPPYNKIGPGGLRPKPVENYEAGYPSSLQSRH